MDRNKLHDLILSDFNRGGGVTPMWGLVCMCL